MPIIFGAQRFSATGGLAGNESSLASSVSENLGWTKGHFNFLGGGDGPSAGRRLSQVLFSFLGGGDDDSAGRRLSEVDLNAAPPPKRLERKGKNVVNVPGLPVKAMRVAPWC